jgi:hypothetical protein
VGDEQDVAVGDDVETREINDVLVPPRHVARAEVAVDGVEHHRSRLAEVVRCRHPDAI